jgi:predicted GIY-YIG superfamily endonuclease
LSIIWPTRAQNTFVGAVPKLVGKKGRALKVERKVKRLPRHKKEALIKTGAGIEALLSNNSR